MHGQSAIGGVLSKLSASDHQLIVDHLRRRSELTEARRAYWIKVESMRSVRQKKRSSGWRLASNDFVKEQPPSADFVTLSFCAAEALARLGLENSALYRFPGVRDFLSAALSEFDFTPGRISEPSFMERYAREALNNGLKPEQILGVYTFETQGLGAADTQAGIDPMSGQGTPMSTAVGYAQLLAANTVNELSTHGEDFLARLAEPASADGQRSKELEAKTLALRTMLDVVRLVPATWADHVAFSQTRAGIGMHAINLDGDLGPWLQVRKLKGILDVARARGLADLTPAELELLNFAGPGSGLAMLEPAAAEAAAANFFDADAYERNPIVHNRTALDLAGEIARRISQHASAEGTLRFRSIFQQLG